MVWHRRGSTKDERAISCRAVSVRITPAGRRAYYAILRDHDDRA
jgi:hypothetical protein